MVRSAGTLRLCTDD